MENNFYAKYIGCSQLTNQTRNIWFAEPAISKCLKHCRYLNFMFAASSNVCICHNSSVGTFQNDSACNLEALKDRHFYGLNNVPSIYEYKGYLPNLS